LIILMLIRFVHTFCLDSTHLSLEEIVELAVAAEKYQVVNLATLCSGQIKKLVRPNTVWTTLDKLFSGDAVQVAVDSCSKVSNFPTLKIEPDDFYIYFSSSWWRTKPSNA
jgi:uncharacterized hydantoinase/oxoprolinase family protein